MRTFRVTICLITAILSAAIADKAAAQTAQPSSTVAPTLIRISGELKTAAGDARTGTVVLAISLYGAKDDLAPRWIEHQVGTLDPAGRYDIQVGATLEAGLPLELFSSGGALWLGVAVENEPEQPRMMLVSLPYAARAASADTLAGNSPSDFVLSTSLPDQVRKEIETQAKASTDGRDGSITNATVGMIPKFTNVAGGIEDSAIAQSGTNIGIGTTSPNSRFHILDGVESEFRLQITGGAIAVVRGVAGAADMGSFSTHPLRIFTSSLERMRITAAGNVGIGLPNPSSKLHVVGDARVTGNITVDGNINAKYQDVAEWVDSTEPLEPGTVVSIDAAGNNRVMAANSAYDSRVAGAVSLQPGVVLGEPGPGRLLVAQSGRVRIKADARYGAIRAGDLLVSSPKKGYAMRSKPIRVAGTSMHRPGTVLGKALEPLSTGTGEILVLLTLQ